MVKKAILQHLAKDKGKSQVQKLAVESAKGRVHGALAHSQKHVRGNTARLEEVVATADKMHKDLSAKIPRLRKIADSAVGEERDTAHRDYLDAVSQLHQCARVHGAAKRELIIARNF